jgi:RIO kinase 1
LDNLYNNRVEAEEGDQAAADGEVDEQVFRKQYIPQTLEQVYDIERDAERIGRGEGTDLVYKDLLAEKVATDPPASGLNGATSSGGAGDDTVESDDDDDSSDVSESLFDKKDPRGKRFQDKDEKKVESVCAKLPLYAGTDELPQEHKKQVKEEKREARKTKLPKHIKKQMISASARQKR